VADCSNVIHEAVHIRLSGRPGPVVVDVPKDILNTVTEWVDPIKLELPGYKPTEDPHPRRVAEAVRLIEAAERPVLYVGGGIIKADAAAELQAFAEAANLPVVTTLMGRGAIPDSHPLALGMPGMHGTYTATTAIQKSDLLIALGVRF